MLFRSKEFFLSENECVKSCPLRTYLDNENRICRQCSSKCLSCYGPTEKDCYDCDSFNGFYWTNDHLECVSLSCSEGSYLSEGKCFPCHYSCKSCKSGYHYDCIECNIGFIPIIAESKHVCEVCSKGFRVDSK